MQGNISTVPFIVGVVAFHTAFAVLEKTRIENFEAKGEVSCLSSSCLVLKHKERKKRNVSPVTIAN